MDLDLRSLATANAGIDSQDGPAQDSGRAAAIASAVAAAVPDGASAFPS